MPANANANANVSQCHPITSNTDINHEHVEMGMLLGPFNTNLNNL